MIKQVLLLIVAILLTLTTSIAAVESSPTEYYLAYPELLPTRPLYKLKVLRDKIVLAIIKDPKKKIDFHLLLADKGILATALLVDYGQEALVGQTALKAEHNMTRITQLLPLVTYTQQMELTKKLLTASKKHQEVLTNLIARVKPETQKTLTIVREFSLRNAQTIEQNATSSSQLP